MKHLACVLHPRAHGLTPYRVAFRRPKNHLRSLLDEGLWYRHPEREETAIVWAQDAASIAAGPDVSRPGRLESPPGADRLGRLRPSSSPPSSPMALSPRASQQVLPAPAGS